MEMSTCSWLRVKPRLAPSTGPRTVSTVAMVRLLRGDILRGGRRARGGRGQRDGRAGTDAAGSRHLLAASQSFGRDRGCNGSSTYDIMRRKRDQARQANRADAPVTAFGESRGS